jgi:PhzF family phenazine biosynthesis protein
MENTDGIRKVFLSGERVFMEQRAPQYTGINAERQEILQALGLQSDDLLTDLPVVRIDTGNAFAIVPTAHAAVLNRVRPDMAAIEQISERHDLIGLYVFALGSAAPGRDATTRMFAPRYGIPEESATGVASGQLACYLHDIMRLPQQRFLIEQGHFMAVPTPSLIQTDVVADMGKIVSVMAGGTGQYELTRQVSLVP